ncbi:uncharacterized protein LOC117505127 [Thalassophryne amazonica]|uniref:uncharacterized protein LOC117505127 n=1 Tax=Thalassophryne amazonica TaxID=390379 RepID=UPI001471535D|nr:uncharacterized protein LOC117505127 [Thalassophryne amazonica]
MKRLLSSLLLASFCGLSSWSVSSTGPFVTQTPDLSVTEGVTVRLSCCWTVEFEKLRVNWIKNHNVYKSQSIYKTNCTRSQHKEECRCSSLTFPNITREDSERYVCRVTVEIPAYASYNGSGTLINVTAKSNKTDKDGQELLGDSGSIPSSIIIPLAVLSPLLVITLICFCTLHAKKAKAARVIYEVPHVDSEEVEMDKHSTSSSRGSSQWCQVLVYESVDYFQHTEVKDSG